MTIAVTFGVTGLYIFMAWNRMTTPDIYIQALESSGVYKEVTNIIEAQVTYYLKVQGKGLVETIVRQEAEGRGSENRFLDRNLIVWTLNTVIDNRSDRVVSALSEKIGLEENIQGVTESALIKSLGWVRGEVQAPQILVSIPTVEQVQSMSENGLARDGLVGIAFNAFGFGELPQCSNSTDEREVLRQIASGDFMNIKCITDRVTPALNERIGSSIPKESLARVETQINERFDLYKLDTLFQGVSNFVLNISQLKENIVQHRDTIHLIRTVSIWMIIISLASSIGAYIFSPKRTLKIFMYIGLTIGVFLSITGSVLNMIINNRITGSFDLSSLSFNSEAISLAQATLLSKSLESTLIYIGDHVHDYVVETGVWFMLVFGVLLLVTIILEKGGKKKILKWYQNMEAEVKNRYQKQAISGKTAN